MATLFASLQAAIKAAAPAVLITAVAGPARGHKMLLVQDKPAEGGLGDQDLDAMALQRARQALDDQETVRTKIGAHDLFFDVYLPPKRLFIVGAVHTAIPLVTFAKTLGYHTSVLDARGAFATEERFAHVDRLITQWPADALAELRIDATSYIVVLTHDPKIDNPVLMLALESAARYVGALGSRRTHAARCDELRALGATEEQLDRIHAPIGLNLGGRRPEEIALAIMAEIVAVEHGVDDC